MEEPSSDCAMKPKTMAELLPLLSGIISKDCLQTMTAKKQPRKTILQTRTAEKVLKPLTIAQMRADILALKVKTPKLGAQNEAPAKRNWNSSVKVDKKISHTGNGQIKNNSIRKALNFQPKPKIASNSRATLHQPTSETPRFPKPELRAKKSLHQLTSETPIFSKPESRAKKSLMQARNVRISGICNIPETPVINKPVGSRMTLSNKENLSNQANLIKKPVLPQNRFNHKKLMPPVLDTPLSNESRKSSCDASFLQNEKDINDTEMKAMAVSEERTLENIAEVTPPMSTPFKEYRSVHEYFNNSSELESSAMYHDNTIMCFDKPSNNKQENQREESVIVSLCELLNKATVTKVEKTSTELDDLLQIKRRIEHDIKMIENIKESQMKSLRYIMKLINEKQNEQKTYEGEQDKTTTPKSDKDSAIGKPCSVIKSCAKSPSYKIPKKNLCLRKKVFCKSMPNISSSPSKDIEGKALNIYLKLKENMNFLNTPVVKQRIDRVPDTPAVTSHNLQKQLNKLYCASPN